MRFHVAVLFIVAAVTGAQAQQAPCTVVGTVGTPLMPNPLQPLPPGGKYYPAPLLVPDQRLPPQAFIAHDGFFHHVPILSVEADEGPRRIVLMAMLGNGRTRRRPYINVRTLRFESLEDLRVRDTAVDK